MNTNDLKTKIAALEAELAAAKAQLVALKAAPVAIALEDVKVTIFRGAGKSYLVSDFVGHDRPACRPNRSAYGSTFEGNGSQITCKTCRANVEFSAAQGETSR